MFNQLIISELLHCLPPTNNTNILLQEEIQCRPLTMNHLEENIIAIEATDLQAGCFLTVFVNHPANWSSPWINYRPTTLTALSHTPIQRQEHIEYELLICPICGKSGSVCTGVYCTLLKPTAQWQVQYTLEDNNKLYVGSNNFDSYV